MAGLGREVDLGVQKADARGVSRRMIGVEHDALAALQQNLAPSQRADAQLGALQIGEDGDGSVFAFKLAKLGDVRPHILVAGMAHVDAEYIRTRAQYALHRSGRLR